MRLISHRGNLTGPSDDANKIDYVCEALNQGFDCEIDVWCMSDKFYLGHDEPQYEVSLDFLHTQNLWIHAKNLEALSSLSPHTCFFWHQNDDFTLTSNNLIWTFPNKKVGDKSVIVDNTPDWKSKEYNCFGVCSDYIDV